MIVKGDMIKGNTIFSGVVLSYLGNCNVILLNQETYISSYIEECLCSESMCDFCMLAKSCMHPLTMIEVIWKGVLEFFISMFLRSPFWRYCFLYILRGEYAYTYSIIFHIFWEICLACIKFRVIEDYLCLSIN